MKHLLLMLAMFMVISATSAVTNPYSHTHHHIAMLDAELSSDIDAAYNKSTKIANAGTAGATALASMPQSESEKGGITMGLGAYSDGRAVAVGYSIKRGVMRYKAGIARTNEEKIAFGVGASFDF